MEIINLTLESIEVSRENMSREINGADELHTNNRRCGIWWLTKLSWSFRCLVSTVKTAVAPVVDMEVYDGNPLNFKNFKTMLKEVGESKIEDWHRKLARLIKYTTGEPKELILLTPLLNNQVTYVMKMLLIICTKSMETNTCYWQPIKGK